MLLSLYCLCTAFALSLIHLEKFDFPRAKLTVIFATPDWRLISDCSDLAPYPNLTPLTLGR